MGKMKINVGTELAPDIRTIGCGSPVGTNALDNPGAESGTTGYSSISALTLSSTTDEARSGTHSFKTETTGYAYEYTWKADQSGTFGSVPCTAGVPITAGGWVKFGSGMAPYISEGQAYIRLSYYNASNVFLSQASVVQVPVHDFNWTLISRTDTPPAGAVKVIVAFNWSYSASPTDYGTIPPGTIAYWDDMFFYAEPPPTGRLKLYADGRIWREVCDDDTAGVPIEIELPGGTSTAVCMVPLYPDFAAAFVDASFSHDLSSTPQYIGAGADEQVGDLVLAFAAMIDTGDVITMPAGWTLERYDLNADGRFGDSRSYVWSRILDATDISGGAYLGPFTVNRTGGGGSSTTWTLASLHYRGPTTVAAAGANVYGTSDGTSTTFDAPSLTPPAGGGILVAAYQLDDSPSGSGPAAMTERVNHSGVSGFTSQSIYDEVVPTGASGIRSRTRTVTRAGVAVGLLLT